MHKLSQTHVKIVYFENISKYFFLDIVSSNGQFQPKGLIDSPI